MNTKLVFILFTLLGISQLHATHNRAGELTYRHISGTTYEITLTTYTDISSTAYRCEHEIYFGDNTSELVNRINGPLGSLCGTTGTLGSGIPSGEDLGDGILKSVYITSHTYGGTGSYFISLNDPDRNHGVCHIPDETPFFIQTELNINPILGINNSPVLLNPPIDIACVGECFEHNPSAYDPDGDSLVFTLVASTGDNGAPIIGYIFPPNMTTSNLDPVKGDLEWCEPTIACQYNVAILIKEYRRLPGSSERFYIGSVLRDMQITVEGNCNNIPPEIEPLNDTCVIAGSNINFGVEATDLNNHTITLSATGSPFEITPQASFSSTPLPATATGIFNWNPTCNQIQLLPYLVTFKAKDDHPRNPLADYETINMQVVSPAPTNLTAAPSGASIVLNWNPTSCNSTSGTNPLINYLVYRKENCDPWIHDICETGAPAYTGYELVGKTEPSITTYTDNNDGQGLTNGIEYSYIIVAEYLDGAHSYASNSVCEKLLRDVPIITNVSIISTGLSDSVWIHWTPPLGDSQNLDTIANAPIYEIKVMQANGFNPSNDSFTEIQSLSYDAFWKMTDTSIFHTAINTQDTSLTYRIDFYSNGEFVGPSNTASSVFLSSSPTDNQVDLSWEENVPWINYNYFIYRETFAGSGVFDLIDSTTSTTYSDTGLVNLRTYCYKIKSEGAFSDSTIIKPLYNYSQIKCDIPIDIIPPCQPDIVTFDNNCETILNTITWRNPDSYCSDDVMTYKVYFAPTNNEELGLLKIIENEYDTIFSHTHLYENITPSIAGCYAIAAIDSTGNESPIVTKQCVDNCPIYELPNVFTPNGDTQNDLYTPLKGYRFVKDVEMKIYTRWGNPIFKTTDRDINWDGTNINNQKPCSEGVYFYVCTINEIRLSGIVPTVKKGFIHLINTESTNTPTK